MQLRINHFLTETRYFLLENLLLLTILIITGFHFDENQRFNLNFSDGDVLKGVNFSKENDYYMSMSCLIEVSNDITKLKQYDDIAKNQSLQIVILEMELIMVLTLWKSKLFAIIKSINLK